MSRAAAEMGCSTTAAKVCRSAARVTTAASAMSATSVASTAMSSASVASTSVLRQGRPGSEPQDGQS
jgi:hypothetical protein